jgi:hypothetical protein
MFIASKKTQDSHIPAMFGNFLDNKLNDHAPDGYYFGAHAKVTVATLDFGG